MSNATIKTTTNGEDLVVPAWFADYTQWHRETVATLNQSNWQHQKYLLLACVDGQDEICAGASDRLQHVPLLTAVAAQQQRLLLLHWSKPCALEEFLVPPNNGLDWRVPLWLAEHLLSEHPTTTTGHEWMYDLSNTNNRTVVRLPNLVLTGPKLQTILRHPLQYPPVLWPRAYRSLWHALFVPSAGVQARIDETRRELGLSQQQQQQQSEYYYYNAIHIRARHAVDTVDRHEEIAALECVVYQHSVVVDDHHRSSSVPILVASDTEETVRAAVEYGRRHGFNVVGRQSSNENSSNATTTILHLDRGRSFLEKSDDWKNHPPAAYYDTFVDLYLLAGSRCLSHGAGGYSQWAVRISMANDDGNQHCSSNYQRTRCPRLDQSREEFQHETRALQWFVQRLDPRKLNLTTVAAAED